MSLFLPNPCKFEQEVKEKIPQAAALGNSWCPGPELSSLLFHLLVFHKEPLFLKWFLWRKQEKVLMLGCFRRPSEIPCCLSLSIELKSSEILGEKDSHPDHSIQHLPSGHKCAAKPRVHRAAQIIHFQSHQTAVTQGPHCRTVKWEALHCWQT